MLAFEKLFLAEISTTEKKFDLKIDPKDSTEDGNGLQEDIDG